MLRHPHGLPYLLENSSGLRLDNISHGEDSKLARLGTCRLRDGSELESQIYDEAINLKEKQIGLRNNRRPHTNRIKDTMAEGGKWKCRGRTLSAR